MAAGGFKEFVAGEVLDEDEINDFLMQGILVFAGTAARGSAITAPVEGQFAFLKDSDTLTYYSGTAWEEFSTGGELIEYVVIAGGGGGGQDRAGGGGAGGYRSNVSGENSGGGVSAEPALGLIPVTYTITVGAGGAGGATGVKGSNSVFGNVRCEGGGFGATGTNGAGGSGGGGGAAGVTTGAAGTARQGFAGGNAAGGESGGGGGGAGAVGVNATTNVAGNGGVGVASSITGSSVFRAGGGGGGENSTGTAGTGGNGGGGNGQLGLGAAAGNGTANTGGGGGGGGGTTGVLSGTPGNGGSGVVIFSVPTGTSVTFSGGVTQTNSTVSGKQLYVVTATSTTSETVVFA
jgi:hypothetical protein